MSGFTAWLQQLDFSNVAEGIISVLASLLCIIIHEVCHGLTAYALGDDTAKKAGRLSLNPLKHVDLIGLIMMAVFKFGWAKAVPVNMNRFRRPKTGMAITAAAGPVSNLLLALIILLIRSPLLIWYYTSGSQAVYYLVEFTEYTAVISIGLAVFNVIPIPPLDGSKVLFSLLPEHIYAKLMRYERWGFLLLMALLFTGVLSTPLSAARSWVMQILMMPAAAFYRVLAGSLV